MTRESIPAPGWALDIHPGYEEVTLVVEGNIEPVLEEVLRILWPGDVLLAPVGAKHAITNPSDNPAKVLAL